MNDSECTQNCLEYSELTCLCVTCIVSHSMLSIRSKTCAFMTTTYSWQAFSITTVAMLHHPMPIHIIPKTKSILYFQPEVQFYDPLYLCL